MWSISWDVMPVHGDTEPYVWEKGERLCAAVVVFGVLGMVLIPVRQFLRPRKERVDGFPMSYYPMFANRRCDTARMVWAVGVIATGVRRNLPHDLLGAGGMNQVRKQMSSAVRAGRGADHARRLADRVAQDPRGADVVRVEIVCGRFDLERYLLSTDAEAREVAVLAGADV